MFGSRLELLRLFGVPIRIDASWFIAAVLIAWSLAAAAFPLAYPGLRPGTYWWMGLAAMVGLFASIVVHELCHTLVARRNAMSIGGITLFVFGGVAEMTEEPRSWRAELRMAAAGPLGSIAIALGAFALSVAVWRTWPTAIVAVVRYLALANGALAVFNLLPAFPLDGGRILRAILWARGHDVWRATRTATRLGTGFGYAIAIVGIVMALTGAVVSGLWWFFIGLFLRRASIMSYQQATVRRALAGGVVASV